MTEIKLKVTDQHLRAVVYPLIASGGINENRITVEFEGTEWPGYVCGVAFNTDDDPDTIYTQNLDSNNQCIVPWEVTEKAGTLFVAVFGTATSDVKRTTEVTAIEIVNGAGNGNAIPAPPTPTVYDQLVALINTKQDLLVSGTNIKTVNNQSLLGSGNITTGGITRYDYGGALFSDLYNTFYTLGRLPVIRGTDDLLYFPVDMQTDSSPTLFTFATIENGVNNSIIKYITIDSSENWSSSSEDVQEKLISGTNIKTINNTSLLGSGDISISGVSDLFVCTWGTTTFNEIYSAVDAGKLPIVFYNSIMYIFRLRDANYCYFGSYIGGTGISYGVKCQRVTNAWTGNNVNLQAKNLVTSISSASTDAQYPSAKCVYDAISAITTSGLAEFPVTLTTANYSSGAYGETVAGLSAYSKFFVMPDPGYGFGKYYDSDLSFAYAGTTFYAYTGNYQSVDLHIVIYAYN